MEEGGIEIIMELFDGVFGRSAVHVSMIAADHCSKSWTYCLCYALHKWPLYISAIYIIVLNTYGKVMARQTRAEILLYLCRCHKSVYKSV